jgi:trehalose/maltose hydrolase-like predicted phosphorylase
MTYFEQALQSDLSDIQQGTSAEGVHLGAMAGTVDLVQRALMGIEVTGDALRLNPQLPKDIKRFEMRMRYRGHSLDLWLTSNMLTVRDRDHGAAPIALQIGKDTYKLAAGSTLDVRLS